MVPVRERNSVRAGIASEKRNVLGKAAQGDERCPCLLTEQDNGFQPVPVVALQHRDKPVFPQVGFRYAFATQIFDQNFERNVFVGDLMFEVGYETRHASGIRVVRRDDQDGALIPGTVEAVFGRDADRKQQADEERGRRAPDYEFQLIESSDRHIFPRFG